MNQVNQTEGYLIRANTDGDNSMLALKNAGILRKLFPDEQYREYAKAQLAIVKTELEFRRQALEIAKNGQIENMRKQVNAWAAVQGVTIDKEKELQLRSLIQEREQEVNQSIDDFLKDYDGAIVRVQGFPEGKPKDFEMKRLDQVLLDFYDTIQFFSTEFKKSVRFESKNF